MSDLDKCGENASLGVEGKKEISVLMKSFHLVDFWRLKNPSSRVYSWFNSDLTIAFRLDRFLISKSLIKSTRSCEYAFRMVEK